MFLKRELMVRFLFLGFTKLEERFEEWGEMAGGSAREENDNQVAGGKSLGVPVSPEEEARRLFWAIFRRKPTEEFVRWFASTPSSVFPPTTERQRENYHRVIRRVRDLEALEFASRFFGRNQLLSHKLRLTVYLAECCPELRTYFVNRKDLPVWRTWLVLARAKLWTAWKLLKGLILLAFHWGP